MSSPKGIDTVEKAFSKVGETLAQLEDAIPQVDQASPTLKTQVSMLGIEPPLKQVAGWYIDTLEDFANYAFALHQESGMSWANDTPWAPFFGIQASIARKVIGNSAMAARFLWQIPPSHKAV